MSQTEEVKRPWSWQTIVADTERDFTKVKEPGVFLKGNRQRYWVDDSGKNCFMLLARDLSITWGSDSRFWKWNRIQGTSDVFVEEAEILSVRWLEVNARFDTKSLSPETLYEVVFVMLMKNRAYGWVLPVNLRFVHPNGTKKLNSQNLYNKPKERDIEISVGEFTTSSSPGGAIEVSLYRRGGAWKRGLVIKGVIIRPKKEASE